jgi:hypothetical protein
MLVYNDFSDITASFIHCSYCSKREKNGELTDWIEKFWEKSYNETNGFNSKELAQGESSQ